MFAYGEGEGVFTVMYVRKIKKNNDNNNVFRDLSLRLQNLQATNTVW